jgi:hypothetical protein
MYCKYCPNMVVLDGRGIWRHTNGVGYSCRNDAGATLRTYAEPEHWLTPDYVAVPDNTAVGRAAVRGP